MQFAQANDKITICIFSPDMKLANQRNSSTRLHSGEYIFGVVYTDFKYEGVNKTACFMLFFTLQSLIFGELIFFRYFLT